MGETASKGKEEERAHKELLPTQNSQVSSQSEGFHILELHTPIQEQSGGSHDYICHRGHTHNLLEVPQEVMESKKAPGDNELSL